MGDERGPSVMVDVRGHTSEALTGVQMALAFRNWGSVLFVPHSAPYVESAPKSFSLALLQQVPSQGGK